jgi:putative ABC transport system permease protein
MNIMLVSVTERTREIGVMKALGATNNQVLTIFLIEAGTVGLVGGVIGVSGGLGLAYLVQFAAKSQGFTYLDVSLRLGMLFFILFLTFLFGAVAGVLPARQAAGLKPAKALRAE